VVIAAILFMFAVEEFGKAVLLREAFDRARSPVTVVGFYNQWRKIEAAGGTFVRNSYCSIGERFNAASWPKASTSEI
jgi:SH3-like domain-containing protein